MDTHTLDGRTPLFTTFTFDQPHLCLSGRRSTQHHTHPHVATRARATPTGGPGHAAHGTSSSGTMWRAAAAGPANNNKKKKNRQQAETTGRPSCSSPS